MVIFGKIGRFAMIIMLLISIVTLFVIKVLPSYLPLKYAITREQIDKSRNYIIVKMKMDSGTCRYEIENNNGVIEPAMEVALVGYDPVYLFNYGIDHAFDNKFVLYGEKVYSGHFILQFVTLGNQ